MEDKKKLAHDIMNAARQHAMKGEHKEAIKSLHDATKLYEEILSNDSETLGKYYMNLASTLYALLDETDESIAYYEKAVKALASLEDKAQCYTELSQIYDIEKDDYIKAQESLNSAIELYISDEKYYRQASNCLDKTAKIYIALGDNEMALNALEKAIKLVEMASDNNKNLGEKYYAAGKLCFDMRQLEKSLDYLDKALDMYKRLYGANSDEAKDVEHNYKIVKAYRDSNLH